MAGYLALTTMEKAGDDTPGGPTEDDYRRQLRGAIEAGDKDGVLEAGKHLGPDWLTTVLEEGATPLHLAVSADQTDVVLALLLAGAPTNTRVQGGNRHMPLHLAAETGNPKVMRALLNKGADPNSKEEELGRCVLHLLASHWGKDREDDFRQCLDALLSCNKIRIDTPDTKKATPLFLAATKSWEHMARRLILKGASLSHRTGRKTTEDVVRTKLPGLLESINSEDIETPVRHYGDELYDALVERDVELFRNTLNELKGSEEHVRHEAVQEKRGRYTLLQYACEHGLSEFVEELTRNGASVSEQDQNSEMSALLYTARNGFYKILEVLLKALKRRRELEKGALQQRDSKQETVLHKVVRREYGKEGKDGVDYFRCLQLLLDDTYKKHLDIDAQDTFGNTPLHLAVLCEEQCFVRLLLLAGSHLGIRNNFGTLAITRINASVLRDVLNDSISHNNNITDNDFEIILHYGLLAPTTTSWRPETESLRFLSTSSKHKELLRHPIIDTFLSLKWQRIKIYYYFNISAYILFLTLLTSYILVFHRSYVPPPDGAPAAPAPAEDSLPGLRYFLWLLISVILVYMGLRECVKMVVSWRRYVARPENWLEVTIVVLTVVLLFIPMGPGAKQNLSAWLILFSWIELVLLLGQYPLLSLYITMFTTVAFNFLKFILIFSFMLVAFSISFFLVFQVEESFATYSGSLLRTLAMATGELEYTSLPLATYPVSSHLFFLVFVFLIVLVLMNLLNGLAVSDIQEISREAEIVSYVSRVELISYIESVFLASPLKSVMPRTLPSCLQVQGRESPREEGNPRNPFLKVLRWLGRHILMFHRCLSHEEPCIKLFPNRAGRRWEVCSCHKSSIEEAQIEAAKEVVLEKTMAVADHRFSGIESRLDEVMSALTALTEKVNSHVLCPSPQ